MAPRDMQGAPVRASEGRRETLCASIDANVDVRVRPSHTKAGSGLGQTAADSSIPPKLHVMRRARIMHPRGAGQSCKASSEQGRAR